MFKEIDELKEKDNNPDNVYIRESLINFEAEIGQVLRGI
jgi:hypothetical protein